MIGKTRAAAGGIDVLDRPAAPRPRADRDEPGFRPTIERMTEDKPAGGRGVLRMVVGILALGLFVLIALVLVATMVLPVGRWIDAATAKTELTGRVSAVKVENVPRPSFVRRWRGPRERLVVKVAPYSFGFAFACDDAEHCRELAGQVKRGGTVSVTVDKDEFEKLKPANRAVDHASRDIGRVGQQIVAAEMDPRRARMFRLVADGVVVLGAE
jgi:hypothetical protein